VCSTASHGRGAGPEIEHRDGIVPSLGAVGDLARRAVGNLAKRVVLSHVADQTESQNVERAAGPTGRIEHSVNPFIVDELARGARLNIRLFIITEIVLVGFAIGFSPFVQLLPVDAGFAVGLTGVTPLLGLLFTVVRMHVDTATKARIWEGLGSLYRAPGTAGDEIQRLNEAVRVAPSSGAVDNIILQYLSGRT
jgi:hypothetical protein